MPLPVLEADGVGGRWRCRLPFIKTEGAGAVSAGVGGRRRGRTLALTVAAD